VNSLAEQRNVLENQIQNLVARKPALMKEIEVLESKRQELANQVEVLTSQIQQLETKRGAIRSGPRPQVSRVKTTPKGPRGGARRVTHTFIGRYEGKEDWNAGLAKLIAQFELSMDPATYSFSPEKIAFRVVGSRDNVEKFAAALNGLEGYVNLRSKLAQIKRSLRESVNARDLHKEQLDALDKNPWYKGSATAQKAQLSQQLAVDGMRIRALSDDLKALKGLLGSNETGN
jgi:chromosome segregation ATPase